MPTPTYDLIASNVLSSSASSVTFSSIPATYRDLVLVVTGTKTTSGDAGALIELNSDTGSNYSYVWAYGTGSSATSYTDTGVGAADVFAIFNNTTPSTNIIQFMDYSATDKHKTILSRTNIASGYVVMGANRWANTAAINSIKINLSTFATGTTFYLFGIVS